MRIRDRGLVLEVDDVPGLHWLLGLLFAGVGILFFVGALGVFTDADKLRWWLRVLISALGAIAMAQAIVRLTLNADRRRGLAEAALATARGLDWKLELDRLDQSYREILEQSHSPLSSLESA